MEVLKRTSKSGKVYRILKMVPAWDLYLIEYAKNYTNNDGEKTLVWFPAYEPKNEVFTSLNECKIALKAFLEL